MDGARTHDDSNGGGNDGRDDRTGGTGGTGDTGDTDSAGDTGRVASFTRDGLTFEVSDTGPVDGDVVVLLHGFPQRADSWDRVAELLHHDGLRTVAPDQRGYSPGARPRGRRAYRSSELVADVVALVEAIGRPVHLVGHDWGAACGWGVVAQHPELVRSWVAVSVPHPAAFVTAMSRSDQALRSWYMALFQVPWLPEWLARHDRMFPRFLRGSGMTPQMLEQFRRQFVREGDLTGPLNWYRGLPFSSPGAVGGRVRVPTTMVWSDGDVALGRAGVELTARWVDAPYELRVLEGVSHWIPDEAPGPLAGAIAARIASVG